MTLAYRTTPPLAAQARKLVAKALGYPIKGTDGGGGFHAATVPTWDGSNACPYGWTEAPTAVYLGGTSEAVCVIPADVAAAVADPVAQARLTPGERGILNAAIPARVDVDLVAFAATAGPQSASTELEEL